MRVFEIIVTLLIFMQSINSQLTRSNEVYENLIKGVCNHYDCQSVILFYLHQNSIHIQDITIETSTTLRDLFIYLNENTFKVVISNIDKFTRLDTHTLQKMENSILVFLGDSDCIKAQLTEQLAPITAMSQLAWLIFLDDNTEIDDFFINFNIPFNCRFMVSTHNTTSNGEGEIITEIYRIYKGTELRYNDFGRWSPNTGMELPKSNLYQRRNNLHGHLLRISIMSDPPTSLLSVDKNNNTKLMGAVGIILDTLKQGMNFTVTYQVGKEYGRPINGSWTGGIGYLVDDLADVMATLILLTNDRLNVIDFSQPLYNFNFRFFSQKPVVVFSWDTFLQPFHYDIWITIACTILFSGVIIHFISWFYMKKFPLLKVNRRPWKVSHSFLDIFGAFCNQGMPKSEIIPIVIVQCTVHLTATIMIAAYSGILISSLTVDITSSHIQTLQDILNDEASRIGVLKSSGLYDAVKYSKDEIIRQMYKQKILREVDLPSISEDGMKRVCSENNYWFLTNAFLASKLRPKGCQLDTSEVVHKIGLAFGMQKNSPFRKIIHQKITLMRDSGMLEKLMGSWSKIQLREELNSTRSVDIFHIISLTIFLIGNYLISLFFLWCEKFTFRQLAKRKIAEMQKIVKQIHIVNMKNHVKTQ